MRRTDKEITDRVTIDAILHEALVLRVAMVDGGNRLYLIPVSFGYQDNSLFIHSAPEGTKLDILKENPEVCFEVDVRTEVHTGEQACNWSMKYFSVVGFGSVTFLSENSEKRVAIQSIMRKYSGQDDWSIPDASLTTLVVWKISITSLTGKKSKYESFEPR
jgi:nitroimidazol reductase NimA-like FMN-containing flavoprotein (pyridoxamine 5'-phosphate oxidase superfamily)